MADSVVTFLLQNLTQLLTQESKLLGGVEDQVKLLKNELSLINVFLQNTEGKRHDKLVKEVVSQIRDVAYEAEDVIDTFVTTVTKHRRRRSKLRKLIHSCDRAIAFHEVASKIESIKNVIKEIYENRSKRRRYVEEDQVVGFDHDTELLVKRLIEGSSHRNVVSIIGMGGLGKSRKTTLARRSSTTIIIRDLLLEILKGLSPLPRVIESGVKLKDMTEDELKSVLLESLKDKRYLLVMDDIWNIEVWNEVSTAFPNNSNRNRILITTRIKEVSLHASSVNNSVPPIPPYELPLLDEDKSWELFSKKVFWEGTCPPELETLGRQLVKSCHGLPLAIVVLGGLLASKEKTHRIWSKYIGHVNSYLTDNRSSCIDILALSYNHLPRRLKPCFLYFGIYPEDFEIPVRQLIRLWIGEGFIRQIGNRNMEDVAEDYLEALIDRSLIQVATKRLDGGGKTCRIHDLLRDLCISESAEEKFLEVHSDVNLSPMCKSRRISIHHANYLDISSNPCEPSNCRSLVSLGGVDTLKIPLDKSYLKPLCRSNKLVRVVELMNMGICCLIPNEIENLIHLKYLSIQSCRLHVIPDSICNLWNLEMLDMRNSTIKSKFLPKGIWKLQKLRHLYLNGSTCLPRTDNRVGLPNLQVLTGIVINQVIESLFAKAKFPSVRKLGLYSLGLTDSTKSGLLSSLLPFRHLQTLKTYRLNEFSRPISFELTLTKITIVCTGLSSGVMRVLSSLTNLRVLKLVGTINEGVSKMTVNCDENSFHQLEVFKMANVDVSEWTMGKGAMPSLQRLVIERCEFTEMPINKLWRLTALQDVEVLHPSPKLAMTLKRLQMRDGCKLQVYPPLDPTTN
ncbi:hypothetical protein ACJW31_07G113600 [Castanea mollissima]